MALFNIGCSFSSFIHQKHGIESAKRYSSKANGLKGELLWSSITSSISEQQLFDDVTYKFSEIVSDLKIRHVWADTWDAVQPTSYITNINTKDINQSLIVEQRLRDFGKCYTFSPSDDMRKNIGAIYYIRARL